VVVFQGVAVQTASAHSLGVIATAKCSGGSAVIDYTATSWDQASNAGSNPKVTIAFNGVPVDTQAFKSCPAHPRTNSPARSRRRPPLR